MLYDIENICFYFSLLLANVLIIPIHCSTYTGTPMLRAYMHGFFIEMSLYSKLRAVSKPFEYEEHRKARIREKVEERRKSRITAQKRLPSVNKQLAEKMLRKKGIGDEDEVVGKDGEGLVDDRFSALFKREEFEQDKESFEYKLRNPTLSNKDGGVTNRRRGHAEEDEDDLNEDWTSGTNGMFRPVEGDGWDEDDLSEDEGQYSDGDGGSSDSSMSVGHEVRYESDGESDEEGPSVKRKKGKKGVEEEGDSEGAIGRATQRILAKRQMRETTFQSSSGKPGKKRATASAGATGPQMFELADGVASERAVFAHTAAEKARRREEKTLGKKVLTDRLHDMGGEGGGGRLDKSEVKILKTKEGLVRELTYMPQKTAWSGDRLEKASREDLRDEDLLAGRKVGASKKGEVGKKTQKSKGRPQKGAARKQR